MSDAVLEESALQSDIARTEEEQAKTAKCFQSQDPFDKISPLEQVQGTELIEITFRNYCLMYIFQFPF